MQQQPTKVEAGAMRLRSNASILLGTFVLVATACGTMVPIEQQELAEVAAATGEDLGGALPEGATINEKGQVVSASGEVLGDAEDFGIDVSSDSGSTTTSSAGTGETKGRAGTGETKANPQVSGVNGPGVTATTIKLGLGVYIDAPYDSIGAEGLTGTDDQKAYDVVIDEINGRGGIGGRKIVPVYHTYDENTAETYAQQDQRACAKWTQDNEVFGIAGGGVSENMASCIANAGAIQIYTDPTSGWSNRWFAKYPHFIHQSGIDINAVSKVYVDSMYRLGFFEKGARIGLLTFDSPDYVYAAQSSLKPALASHGLELTDEAYLPTDEGNASLGELSGAVANAAVRFKGNNITHVLILDNDAHITFFFAPAAESQQYRPRYALNTTAGNTAIVDEMEADTVKAQFKDALSIGWAPTTDVRVQDEPDYVHRPPRRKCLEMMRSNGVEMDSRFAQELAEQICDVMWFYETALKAAGPVLNQDTFLQALNKVGNSYVPAGAALAFNVSSTRRDTGGAVADMKFVDSCACFRYTSGPHAVPN